MSLINWHQEIKEKDKEKYDQMINEMLSIDNLDSRINICYDILFHIQKEYPIFYPYLESEIKELTLA